MLEHMRREHNSDAPSFQPAAETTDIGDTDSEEIEALEAVSYTARYPQGMDSKDIPARMRLTIESLAAEELHVDGSNPYFLGRPSFGRKRWNQVWSALIADGHKANSIVKYKPLLQLYVNELAGRAGPGERLAMSRPGSKSESADKDDVAERSEESSPSLKTQSPDGRNRTAQQLDSKLPVSDDGSRVTFYCSYEGCASQDKPFKLKSDLHRHVAAVHTGATTQTINSQFINRDRRDEHEFDTREKMIEPMRDVHKAGHSGTQAVN
jgi:hypothetical protein